MGSEGLGRLKNAAVKDFIKRGGTVLENKKEIIRRLKEVLIITRAGEDILDLTLSKNQDKVTVFYKNGHFKIVNIEADSGVAIIQDVVRSLY